MYHNPLGAIVYGGEPFRVYSDATDPQTQAKELEAEANKLMKLAKDMFPAALKMSLWAGGIGIVVGGLVGYAIGKGKRD